MKGSFTEDYFMDDMIEAQDAVTPLPMRKKWQEQRSSTTAFL